jgi:hypothetical protein
MLSSSLATNLAAEYGGVRGRSARLVGCEDGRGENRAESVPGSGVFGSEWIGSGVEVRRQVWDGAEV